MAIAGVVLGAACAPSPEAFGAPVGGPVESPQVDAGVAPEPVASDPAPEVATAEELVALAEPVEAAVEPEVEPLVAEPPVDLAAEPGTEAVEWVDGASASAVIAGSSKLVTAAKLMKCPGKANVCHSSKAWATYPAGTKLTMECWTDNDRVAGKPRWFFVTVGSRVGWFMADVVGNQTKVDNCTSRPGVMAAMWATSYSVFGRTQPNTHHRALMAKYYGFSNWGRKVDWSGDCVSFASVAYLSSGKPRKIVNANAYDIFRTYRGRGMVKTTGTPPIGALVFWNAYAGGKNYGHVAVSIGNGWVAGTEGWDDQMLANSAEPISKSNYLGWVKPY